MEKLRVAVCDDDAAALGIIANSLKGVFAQHGTEADISLFQSADALGEVLPTRSFDLLLLDIDMPGVDGIEFARRLREQRNQVDIMYISNREDRVFDSLRVSPVGFIRKSRFLDDMSEIVGSYLAFRKGRTESRRLVQTRDSVKTVPLDKVLYVEGARKSQVVHLAGAGGTMEVHRSMQDLEDELAPNGFIRVHKGFLVNCQFIKVIEDSDVVLTNDEAVPVSRRKLSEVRERFLSYLQQHGSMVF